MSGVVSRRVLDYSTLNFNQDDKSWMTELETLLVHLSLSKQDVIHIVQLVSSKVKETREKEEVKSKNILKNTLVKRQMRAWANRYRFKKMLFKHKRLKGFVKEFIESETLYNKKLQTIQSIKDEIFSKIKSGGSPSDQKKTNRLSTFSSGFNAKGVGEKEYYTLFGHHEVIYGLHRELGSELANSRDSDARLPLIISFLNRLSSAQRHYLPFMKEYQKVVETLRECITRKKFKEIVEKSEHHTDTSLTAIYSAMLYRIDDYASATQVLLKNITEDKDMEILQTIYKKIRSFQQESVKLREVQESFDKALAVQQRVANFPAGQLIPQNRQFILEGSLVVKTEQGTKAPSLVYLFSDIIVFSAPKTGEFSYLFPTNKMLFKDVPTSMNGDHCIELKFVDGQKLQIFATKKEEKAVWYQGLDAATRSFRTFGVPIEVLTARDGGKVPAFFSACVDYLTTAPALTEEGLFRISAPRPDLEKYQGELDLGNKVSFKDLNDPHIVSGLLKMWFKSLPHPLLLSENEMETYNTWISATSESSDQMLVKAKNFVDSMPEANRRVAKKVMKMLVKITREQAKNKMSLNNLAIVFSPILLHPRDEKFQTSIARSTAILDNLKSIIEFLGSNYSIVFAKQKANDSSGSPSAPGVTSAVEEKNQQASALRGNTRSLTKSFQAPSTPPTKPFKK
eukprot:TRINITY_DN10723_c0_g1_i1.p1 TRINITY_DN10723_c0_g1~~TRINITY_DN10723_c0_g1_i1.p1  ORF type:complete len:681 (+),score=135.35 TRINITY_DN10723_c0_g1_i1:28-2070(+)